MHLENEFFYLKNRPGATLINGSAVAAVDLVILFIVSIPINSHPHIPRLRAWLTLMEGTWCNLKSMVLGMGL